MGQLKAVCTCTMQVANMGQPAMPGGRSTKAKRERVSCRYIMIDGVNIRYNRLPLPYRKWMVEVGCARFYGQQEGLVIRICIVE